MRALVVEGENSGSDEVIYRNSLGKSFVDRTILLAQGFTCGEVRRRPERITRSISCEVLFLHRIRYKEARLHLCQAIQHPCNLLAWYTAGT